MVKPFVPPTFTAPSWFEGDGFRLQRLGPEHNQRDHDAWMSSIDHIHATPGFEDSDWPMPMSLEANLADLERHAADFAQGDGFTYSVLAGDEVIGCVYVYPPRHEGHDAAVRSWVRESRSDMDASVWRGVSAWLASAWPFAHPEYAPRSTHGSARPEELRYDAAVDDADTRSSHAAFGWAGLLAAHRDQPKPYLEFIRRESLSAGLYVLPAGSTDEQQPHNEDELYVVMAGGALFTAADESREVRAGDVFFVAAGVPHSFHDISEELRLIVVFAPAESDSAEH